MASALRTQAGVLGICFHFFGGVSSRAQRMHSVCISLHLDDIVLLHVHRKHSPSQKSKRARLKGMGCCWIADRLMLYIIDTLYISTSYPLRLCSIVGCKELCAARPLSKQHHGIQPDGSQRSAKYKHRPRRSPKHQFEIFSCGWESQCVIRAMICKLMRLH